MRAGVGKAALTQPLHWHRPKQGERRSCLCARHARWGLVLAPAPRFPLSVEMVPERRLVTASARVRVVRGAWRHTNIAFTTLPQHKQKTPGC
jgi:hypothetical protein